MTQTVRKSEIQPIINPLSLAPTMSAPQSNKRRHTTKAQPAGDKVSEEKPQRTKSPRARGPGLKKKSTDEDALAGYRRLEMQRRQIQLSHTQGELIDSLKKTAFTRLTPTSFFVAWHGVLALVFSDFTPPVPKLKTEMSAMEYQWGLPFEQSPSKWPKMNLGCLREGLTLTLDQLRALQKIVDSFRETVRVDPWKLNIRHLSTVMYACRSLERTLWRSDVSLEPSRQEVAAGVEPPSANPSATVQHVLSECTSDEGVLANYIQNINKNGGRENHYTDSSCGMSLVAFAHDPDDSSSFVTSMLKAPLYLAQFRSQVDAALPGYYTWFPWESLHCTIRTLS